jgi:hypothetical protein
MKLLSNAALAVLLMLAAGCDSQDMSVSRRNGEVVDTWLVQSMQDAQVNNAVIRQHTMYPYHFVENSADLNELGQRDLDVLAGHFRDNPGQMNLRRGEASEELWKARCQTVVNRLAQDGVDINRVKVDDGLPGGDGITSTEVVLRFKKYVLSAEDKEVETTTWTSTSGGNSNTEKP